MKVYQRIAQVVDARLRCIENGSTEWEEKHTDTIHQLEILLPHVSGIDTGCRINLDKSKPNKIIIHSHYHAMNENGFYDGWYGFKVIVTPNLIFNFDLKIIGDLGKYRNVKDYLYDVFSESLEQQVDANI